MAFNNFAFDPPGGFADTDFYDDTPADSREVLQRQHDQTKDYINSLVGTLSNSTEGESGSENIASPAIEGVSGNNVYDQIKDLKRQMTDMAEGVIPDGSVTTAKLASKSVTSQKIDDLAIQTGHFSLSAVAPMSSDTQKVNGVFSYAYEPVETFGGIGAFRERVLDNGISTVRGKTREGYRYIVDYSGKISRLSLSDFTLGEYADFSSYSTDPSIAFDGEGILYAGYIYKKNADYYYFKLFRYSDGEFVGIADVCLFPSSSTYSSRMLGMEIYDGKLYVFCRHVGSRDFIYVWRVDLSDAGDENSYEKIVSESAGSKEIYPFIYDGDLYVGNKVFEDCDPESGSSHLYYYVYPVEGKGFISDGDVFLMCDTEYRPCLVSSVNKIPDPSNSFCHGKYLYMIFENYLFRARIY